MEQHGEPALAIMPRLRAGGKAVRVYVDVARTLSAIQPDGRNGELHELRDQALRSAADAGAETQVVRVCVSVLCDLWVQGWTFRADGGLVLAKPPEANGVSPELEKARLRAAHLHARNAQLRKPAIREF